MDNTTAPAAAPSVPAPSTPALWRRALAEFVGTGLLVALVVGSGIMAQQLSTDVGLQLLENSIATAFGLAVLIVWFQPISGAHFNPVVTLTESASGPRTAWLDGLARIAAQISGGLAGAALANVMFELPTTISTTERISTGTFIAEIVATAGLVGLIHTMVRAGRGAWVGPAVGAYIGAAYWFTSSTSFANPAVTIGRIISDTFAGIEPSSAPWFILAQLIGAAVGTALALALVPRAAAE